MNAGLQRGLDLLSGINGPPAALQSMSVDNATGSGNAFAAANTKLNDAAGATSFSAKAFDATFPSRSGQVTTFQSTFGTSDANFTIGRIALHGTAAGSVSLSSTGLYGGVDQQSLTKTSSFTLIIQLNITASSA